jgi:hypothetical protein
MRDAQPASRHKVVAVTTNTVRWHCTALSRYWAAGLLPRFFIPATWDFGALAVQHEYQSGWSVGAFKYSHQAGARPRIVLLACSAEYKGARKQQILATGFANDILHDRDMSPTYLRAVRSFQLLLIALTLLTNVLHGRSQDAKPAKTFIDYFLSAAISGSLATNVWGAAAVGPRDPGNGLEDATLQKWNYWDGAIIRGPDGRFHMFASRWDQASGHGGWFGSKAVHAVSDHLIGPYVDKGLCWPDSQGGKGHNVIALALPDGRYAVVISETRPGTVFVSRSLDGPWEQLGVIEVARNVFSKLGRMSNTSMMVRPDGNFEIVPRSGAILISTNGVLGPYVVQGPSIYPGIKGLPQNDRQNLEDPVIWFSGGQYHIVVNNWSDRKAYHLTSVDGIRNWTYRGLAYDPTRDFVRYTEGTVNRWEKLERPSVFIQDGHVVAVTFAVIDVPKEQEKGNDNHGSKIIVVPFDGVAMDRDLQSIAK